MRRLKSFARTYCIVVSMMMLAVFILAVGAWLAIHQHFATMVVLVALGFAAWITWILEN